jgi:hypothetical protein
MCEREPTDTKRGEKTKDRSTRDQMKYVSSLGDMALVLGAALTLFDIHTGILTPTQALGGFIPLLVYLIYLWCFTSRRGNMGVMIVIALFDVLLVSGACAGSIGTVGIVAVGAAVVVGVLITAFQYSDVKR